MMMVMPRCANLVYQSDYEIGGTFQVLKQMKMMTDDGDAMLMIKCLDLEKKKEKNKKLKAKVKLIGAFWFSVRDT